MRRILILTKSIVDNESEYIHEAEKKGIQIVFAVYDDVIVRMVGHKNEISISNYNLSEFSLVYFRTVGTNVELQLVMSLYCQTHGIPVIDEARALNHWFDGKLYQYFLFHGNGIPIAPSIYISKRNAQRVLEYVNCPCIAKISEKNRGEGVYLLQSSDELESFASKQDGSFIIQEFINTTGYVRCLVIGEEVIGAVKRQPDASRDTKHKIVKNPVAQSVSIDTEMRKLCLAATKLLKIDIAGVDLMFNPQTHCWIVLEVNIAPIYTRFSEATGISVVKEIVSLLQKRIDLN